MLRYFSEKDPLKSARLNPWTGYQIGLAGPRLPGALPAASDPQLFPRGRPMARALILCPRKFSLIRVENPTVPRWCGHWPKSLETPAEFDWDSEFLF